MLFYKTFGSMNVVTQAEFILDVLGGNGNAAPEGPVQFADRPGAFIGIAHGQVNLAYGADLAAAQAEQSRQAGLGELDEQQQSRIAWEQYAYPAEDMAALGLSRTTPDDVARTRIAFQGSEHQIPRLQDPDREREAVDKRIGGLRRAFGELDEATRERIVDNLQDTSELDLGFAPHTISAIREAVGGDQLDTSGNTVDASYITYKLFLGVLGQVCQQIAQQRQPNTVMTVNIAYNKIQWPKPLTATSSIKVLVGESDPSGVRDAILVITP